MKNTKKRVLSVLAAAALSFSAVPQSAIVLKPVLTASAETYTAGNFTYEFNADDSGVIIKEWNSKDAVAEIPGKIEGLPVTEIGKWAFSGCETVEKVTLPNTITFINDNAFSGCTKLTEINIPDSVTQIGNGSFSRCEILSSITIPDSVTSLGSQVFASCKELSKIDIPSTLTNIGGSAFRDTKWLSNKQSEKPLVIVNNILIDGTAATGSVKITDKVNSICDMAFSGCRAITDISIPNGVTYIGEGAFSYCSELSNVSIPDSVEFIGYQAFGNCTSLAEISIPDSVKTIKGSTFYCCTQLTTVKLPTGLESIPNSMFYYCPLLSDITIPDSVKGIDANAFLGCTSLTDIVIPEGTERIDMQAFVMCSSLKSIRIPDSVTSIGIMAFSRCPDLTINANCGSFAEKYAKNNDIPFNAFDSVSLTLSDDLGINFYVGGVDTAAAAADYRVKFSGKCEEKGKSVSLKKKNGRYCATANVTADHMDEDITAVLERKGSEGWEKVCEYSYSVNKYLDSVDTAGNDALAKLVAATKDYGQVTESYFSDGTVAAITSAQKSEVTKNVADAGFTSAQAKLSLVLDSKLAARIYIPGAEENAQAACQKKGETSSSALTAKAGGKGGVYFEIPGLAPTDLNTQFTITFGTEKYTFTPLSWAKRVMDNSASSNKNKAMAYALYKYYTTAKAFANS